MTTQAHDHIDPRRTVLDTRLLAGISTSGCVQSTVLDAYDRDYRVIVLADACADPEDVTLPSQVQNPQPGV